MTQSIAEARNAVDAAFQELAGGAGQNPASAGSILGNARREATQRGRAASVSTILAGGASTEGRRASKALASAMNAAKAANTALWALAYGTAPAVLSASQEGEAIAKRDCNAALIEFDEPWPLADGELQPGDRRALIAPDEGFQPEAGMSLGIGGTTWQIVRARRLAPAGAPLLFLCQVRP